MPTKKKASQSDSTNSFEDALEELDQLTERLSHEPESLSKMIDDYERGQHLIKQCHHQLNSARKRITLIQAELKNATAEDASESSDSISDDNNDVRLF